MKKADMNAAIAAHKTVAVFEGWKPKGEIPRGAREAQIIEVGVMRRVYTERDFRGHIANDGVRVEYADSPPGHSKRPIITAAPGWSRQGDVVDMETNDRVVGPRDVIDTWDSYQANLVQRENEREVAQRNQRTYVARLDEAAATVNELLKLDHPGARKSYRMDHRGGGHYDGVLIPVAQLEDLLDLIPKEES